MNGRGHAFEGGAAVGLMFEHARVQELRPQRVGFLDGAGGGCGTGANPGAALHLRFLVEGGAEAGEVFGDGAALELELGGVDDGGAAHVAAEGTLIEVVADGDGTAFADVFGFGFKDPRTAFGADVLVGRQDHRGLRFAVVGGDGAVDHGGDLVGGDAAFAGVAEADGDRWQVGGENRREADQRDALAALAAGRTGPGEQRAAPATTFNDALFGDLLTT